MGDTSWKVADHRGPTWLRVEKLGKAKIEQKKNDQHWECCEKRRESTEKQKLNKNLETKKCDQNYIVCEKKI